MNLVGNMAETFMDTKTLIVVTLRQCVAVMRKRMVLNNNDVLFFF